MAFTELPTIVCPSPLMPLTEGLVSPDWTPPLEQAICDPLGDGAGKNSTSAPAALCALATCGAVNIARAVAASKIDLVRFMV